MRSRTLIAAQSAVLAVVAAGLFATLPAPGAGAQPTTLPGPAPSFVEQRLGALESAAGGEVRHRVSRRSGAVTYLGAPRGRAFPARGQSAEAKARSFLASEAALLGLDRAGDLAAVRTAPEDAVGLQRVRFRQEVGGVPVAGGEVSVHVRGSGVAVVFNRTAPGVGSLSTRPALSAGQATEKARAALAGRQGNLEGLEFLPPRLEILDRAHLGGPPAPVRLAWFVEARSLDRREFVWVDAGTGLILLRFDQLPHARDRRVYDASAQAGVLPGSLVRSEGGGMTGDTDADDAYDFSGDTYDYFFTLHGRDSYDGAGATLHSTVHYCPNSGPCPYANAFWNGEQMVYGDGFSAADDVVAHELTHAVTSSTAQLFYYMQSGALNESFSDIFGEAVDLGNGKGNDAAAERWNMGEDLPATVGVLRNLMSPAVYGDPGRVGHSYYVCQDPGTDAGGVHSNSGVPNHAFALMADGGNYNGVAVSGIGLDEAGRIQYRALTEYLLSSSDFVDAAAALAQSCLDLVGSHGITAADCTQVENATRAVEMDEAPTCATTPSPAVCPAGQVAEDVFFDDFEELAGGDVNDPALLSSWTVQTQSGQSHWGECCLGPFASSGTGNAWGYNLATGGDSALSLKTGVLVPPGPVYARFEHSFGFENTHNLDGSDTYWDGGVVEYSTDGGATWLDAGGLIGAGQGYTGVIDDDFNPIGGRPGFVGDSHGYTGTLLDLSNFSGQSMRFRFRIGTDNVFDDYGWFIDDFRVYTCALPPEPCDDEVLYLAQETVTGTVSIERCNTIVAGTGYQVGGGGQVSLTAPRVELHDGFSVADGGVLAVGH